MGRASWSPEESSRAAERDVRRRFDRWAFRYERDWLSRVIARAQMDGLDSLRLGPADRLLDVGCGTGAAVRRAALVAERAAGVDISPEMIRRARELAADLENVDFAVGSSESLAFADGEFTAVLCTTSFHHYADPARALAEMARILRPGGRIALVDDDAERVVVRVLDRLLRRFEPGHVGFHGRGELTRLVAAAGFDDVSARAVRGRTYAIVAGTRGAW